MNRLLTLLHWYDMKTLLSKLGGLISSQFLGFPVVKASKLNNQI